MNTIIIDKNGMVSEKIFKGTLDKLYTLCNYRNNTNFMKLYEYSPNPNIYYELYGKRNGKANYENKYKVNNETFYGTLCMVKIMDEQLQSITMEEWNKYFQNKIQENDNEVVEKEPYFMDDKELLYDSYEE